MTRWLTVLLCSSISLASLAEKTNFERAREKFAQAQTLDEDAISDPIFQDCVVLLLSSSPEELKLTIKRKKNHFVLELRPPHLTEKRKYPSQKPSVFEDDDLRMHVRRLPGGEILAEYVVKDREAYENIDGEEDPTLPSLADPESKAGAYLYCHIPTWKKELDKSLAEPKACASQTGS